MPQQPLMKRRVSRRKAPLTWWRKCKLCERRSRGWKGRYHRLPQCHRHNPQVQGAIQTSNYSIYFSHYLLKRTKKNNFLSDALVYCFYFFAYYVKWNTLVIPSHFRLHANAIEKKEAQNNDWGNDFSLHKYCRSNTDIVSCFISFRTFHSTNRI